MSRRIKSGLAALLLWGFLNGCAALEPTPYHDDRESMQGPGLFSGEDGVFTIYQVPAEEKKDKDGVDLQPSDIR